MGYYSPKHDFIEKRLTHMWDHVKTYQESLKTSPKNAI